MTVHLTHVHEQTHTLHSPLFLILANTLANDFLNLRVLDFVIACRFYPLEKRKKIDCEEIGKSKQ